MTSFMPQNNFRFLQVCSAFTTYPRCWLFYYFIYRRVPKAHQYLKRCRQIWFAKFKVVLLQICQQISFLLNLFIYNIKLKKGASEKFVSKLFNSILFPNNFNFRHRKKERTSIYFLWKRIRISSFYTIMMEKKKQIFFISRTNFHRKLSLKKDQPSGGL